MILLCVAVSLSFRLAAANQNPDNIAGKWTVTVRMPGHVVTEQWVIQQKGNSVTGAAQSDHGELPLSGTIEGAFLRVSVHDGQKEYKVRATVDEEAMDGSITLAIGEERLWFAKRAR
ncbi:MAG TPA: hypothetical protein VH640_02985 [Bryobacteraceae bacterium]|jgi:hypothetical protein